MVAKEEKHEALVNWYRTEFVPTTTINKRNGYSYRLKHAAEHQLGSQVNGYVSENDLRVAMKEAGYQEHGENHCFCIANKSPAIIHYLMEKGELPSHPDQL
jgi:metal-dependent HD superfamily phosphatase/phosphodiesterase